MRTGRVAPGEIFLVDLAAGEIVPSDQLKHAIATEHPYGTWVREQKVQLADLPSREHIIHSRSSVVRRQQTFGYTEEELRILLAPMAAKGAEPLGAMGTDTPIAVLSERPRLLFDYFTQMFAQVTNPPLDSLREEIVTSLGVAIGQLAQPARRHRRSTPASSGWTSRSWTTTSSRRSSRSMRTPPPRTSTPCACAASTR